MNNTNQDSSPVKNDLSELDQDGDKEADLGFLGNPTPPPDVDLDKLRGDRIGDTVYSGKWCIQTVMKLMQSNVVIKAGAAEDGEDKTDVDMEEELQNEVGALWDMTINVDVCLYLHSIGAVESICYIITNSQCPRATEMCVGMLANIITHHELWRILSGETAIFDILIQLLTNIDQPVLLQVTRFFNTALCHTDHLQCHTSLCECSSLVTQELMRILSGSTNADLLKQAAELTYMLMSLDEADNNFCALFADVDYVSSLVEASKELGYSSYEHETSGQNYIMDVFNYFTTYEAGVLAIENMLEQIADANTHYLKVLCHNLHLYNSSRIITTIIATLNHIFCRHKMVRVGLMSSPSFIHSVLKTLVAVYRKLGFYNSIAYPKSRSKVHSSKATSTWKMEEEAPAHRKTTDTASWSERAIVASSTSTSFRTPDASPIHVQQNRELEVSWSERRMSSPLVDDLTEEKWKRPKGKKRLKRKDGFKGSSKYDADENNIDSQEMNCSGGGAQEVPPNSEKHPHKDSSVKGSNVSSEEQSGRLDIEQSQDENVCALKLNHEDRYKQQEGGRKSEEFTPQKCFEEMDNDRHGNELINFGYSKIDEKEVLPQAGNCSFRASGSNSECIAPAEECFLDKNENHSTELDATSTCAANSGNTEDDLNTMLDETESKPTTAGDDGQHTFTNNEDSNDGFLECDHEDAVSNSDGLNGDKYHKLLTVITDFLTDYLTNLRETITRDDGRPCLQDVMHYFNTQCSSVEIRAIAKCVGTGTEKSQPLGRLLHMCDYFRAKHMKSVLEGFISRHS